MNIPGATDTGTSKNSVPRIVNVNNIMTTPLRGNKSPGVSHNGSNVTTAKVLFQNGDESISLTSVSTMASKTSKSSEKLVNPYAQSKDRYLAVSTEAKIARDILLERERAYHTHIRIAGKGTVDGDNPDLHKAVIAGYEALVHAASTKLKAIQAKDRAYSNVLAHRTSQNGLTANANDRATRQKRVDKNNEKMPKNIIKK